MNTSSFTTNSCYAWGACIETTLLTDLSEEERSSLAEHIPTCSACARRFRTYQFVEEFAGELPQCSLYAPVRRPRWTPETLVQEKRRGAHFVEELAIQMPQLALFNQPRPLSARKHVAPRTLKRYLKKEGIKRIMHMLIRMRYGSGG